MGSSASKASRTAGQAARVYPKQASQAATRSSKPSQAAASRASQPGPAAHPAPEASETADESSSSDAQDLELAAKLRSIGAVQPNPYYSHNSTSPFDPRRPPSRPSSTPNPALSILSARDRLQREAEADLEYAAKPSAPGRRFVDPMLIRRVLVMRDRERKTDDVIEEEMGLERGFMKRLGPKGVVEAV
ncbi:hypothetical protein JOL62DRAFT_547145 [Phyllosticta paracitricarpa]|uniref:Helix-turn-helix domain-containing protein n=2 Tax=Phyllosticta TaxID=121621 RepID=A0ABR1MFE7_9PEZI